MAHPMAPTLAENDTVLHTQVLAGPPVDLHGGDYSWRWKEDESEAVFWSEWFSIPPVDMTLGRLLDAWASGELPPLPVAAQAPVVATSQALPAPVASAAVNEVHLGLGAAMGERLDVPTSPFADVSLQQLFDGAAGVGRVQVRLLLASQVPWLVVEGPLPAGTAARLLQALEALEAPGLGRWLRAQLMLACVPALAGAAAEHAHAQVQAMVHAGAAAGDQHVDTAHWQALGLLATHVALERQGPAARTIGFAALRHDYEALPARTATVIQLAWLEILQRSAVSLRGPAAIARLDEAEMLCQMLIADHPLDMEGPRLLAVVLQRRAAHERAAEAAATLERAVRLAQFALSRSGTALAALTLAEVMLAQASYADPVAARGLLEGALLHCMNAAGDPASSLAAERVRLSVQMAFGQSAGAPTLPVAALELDTRLQEAQRFSTRDWEGITTLLLQQGEFERACQLSEAAARQHAATPNLLVTWERASAAWHARRPQGPDRLRWQANVRAREYARLSLSLSL